SGPQRRANFAPLLGASLSGRPTTSTAGLSYERGDFSFPRAENRLQISKRDARPLGVAGCCHEQAFEFGVVSRVGPLDELVERLLFYAQRLSSVRETELSKFSDDERLK